jgi:hypothetical protein
MSEATKSAADAVVAGMFQEAAGQGFDVGEDNREMLAEIEPEAETPTTSGEAIEQSAREEMESKTEEVPEYAYVPDDELAEFDEQEAEEELSNLRERLEETLDEDFEPDAADQEDLDELRKRLYKAEKALENQKRLRARQQSENWQREAAERYPLANLDGIKEISRSAYMKAAAQSHNMVLTHIQPHLAKLEAERAELMKQTKAEARQEAADAWGQPTVGGTPGEIDVAAFASELEESRTKQRPLHERLGLYRKYGRGGVE